jgi:hypothetical protein
MISLSPKLIKNISYHWRYCFAICLAIYLPVALSHYMMHDDYLLTHDFSFKGGFHPVLGNSFPLTSDCRKSPIYWSLLNIGRPISGESNCLIYYFYSLKNIIYYSVFLRLVNLFMIASAWSMFSFWIYCRFKNKLFSILISSLIFTLPGIQLFASSAISTTHTFTLPLIMLSIIILDFSYQDYSQTDLRNKKFLLKILISISLLIFCMLTYQATTLFFLIPSAVLLIFSSLSEWKIQRTVIILHLMVFSLAAAIYMLICKILIAPIISNYHPEILTHQNRSLELSTSIQVIWQNITAFFDFLSLRALNLWFLQDEHTPAKIFLLFIGLTILAFCLIEIVDFIKIGISWYKVSFFIQRTILFIFVFLGINILFFVNAPFPAYRVLFAYSAVVVLLLIWAIKFWMDIVFTKNSKNVKHGLLFILVVMVVFSAGLAQYYTIRYVGLNSIIEMSFLEAKVQPMLGNRSAIYIIRPVKNTFVFGDEFSKLTTSSAVYGVTGMMKVIYSQYGLDTSKIEAFDLSVPARKTALIKIYSQYGLDTSKIKTFDDSQQIIALIDYKLLEQGLGEEPQLINMNFLLGPQYEFTNYLVKSSSVFQNLGASLILAPEEFSTVAWHAQKPPQYPEWLVFDFGSKISFSRISIRSQLQVSSQRGPKEFILQSSENGKNWKNVFSVADACTIKGGDWKKFTLPKMESTRFARILFLSNCGDPNLLTLQNISFDH